MCCIFHSKIFIFNTHAFQAGVKRINFINNECDSSYLHYAFTLKVKIPILPKDIRNMLLDIDNDCPKFQRSTYLTYKSM